MIIKRKKNARMYYEPKTSKYYLDKIKSMQEFENIQEAFQKYHEFHKWEREEEQRFFENGYLKYEFLPEQVFLIAKSLQIFKFFVDNSFFFKCSEELESKSIDLFYLYQIVTKEYMAYIPKEIQQKIEKENRYFQEIDLKECI